MTAPQPLWHVPVRAQDVPQAGAPFALEADEAARAAIAEAGDFLAVPRLAADFVVEPSGHGGLHVTGTVSATVGQTCVVTLEPITSEIVEPVDVTFAPEGQATADDAGDDLDAEVDELKNGAVDLGALAVEFLMLGVDPYPRKPDAVFEPPATEAEDVHPFAALAALKARSKTES